ncbi:MAG: DUF2802 domain-containing protein [Gammaproteobacteria bacterium]
MTTDINAILALAGTILGIFGLVLSLFAVGAVRRWQSRCISMESSLAALRRVEQDYAGVAERVDLLELRGSAQSFDQAIASARRGIDSGRLAQQFGLSRSEADLVTRLHGRKKVA